MVLVGEAAGVGGSVAVGVGGGVAVGSVGGMAVGSRVGMAVGSEGAVTATAVGCETGFVPSSTLEDKQPVTPRTMSMLLMMPTMCSRRMTIPLMQNQCALYSIAM